jgi:hypothetical protein
MSDVRLDRIIIGALAVDEVDADAYERARARAHAVVYELADRPRREAARPAHRSPRMSRARRVAFVMVLLLLLMAAAVAANPDLRSRILGSDEPAADRMEAFRSPGSETQLPAVARQQLANAVAFPPDAPPPHAGADTSELDGVRRLVDGELEQLRVAMWGVRTPDDRACFVVVVGPQGTDFAGSGSRSSCVTFAPGFPISASQSTAPGGVWLTYGAVVDGVSGVRLHMADGTSSSALLGDNAFAWATTGSALPVAIEAVLVDGSTVRRDLPLAPDRT